jgi:hypothetical protein
MSTSGTKAPARSCSWQKYGRAQLNGMGGISSSPRLRCLCKFSRRRQDGQSTWRLSVAALTDGDVMFPKFYCGSVQTVKSMSKRRLRGC